MARPFSLASRLGVAAAVVLLAANWSAAQLPPPPPTPGAVPPRAQRLKNGEIDTDLSRVYVFVDKTGFGHQHGVVGRLKGGYIRVGADAPGKLLFDMASFRADTRDARRRVGVEGATNRQEQDDVTANMQGEAVLDVAHFPTAFYVINTIRRYDEGGLKQFALEGNFTLHGVTQPLNLTATAEHEQGYLHLKGQFRLKQTEYGIRPFRKALGAVGVADALTVYGDLWIKQ
jgi:polyisoprenoid-binding protein YceI